MGVCLLGDSPHVWVLLLVSLQNYLQSPREKKDKTKKEGKPSPERPMPDVKLQQKITMDK